MKFVVHLRVKRQGEVVVDARTSQEACNMVKRLIHLKRLPENALGDELVYVTYIEEK